jgi:hypothetical protein
MIGGFRTLGLLWLGILIFLAWPSAALSQSFTPCPGPAINDRLAPAYPEFACQPVLERKTGIMNWRIARDKRTTDAFARSYLEQIDEVFTRALNIWGAVTPIEVKNVTVIPIGPEVKRVEKFDKVEARAFLFDTKAKSECIIMLDEAFVQSKAKAGVAAATDPRYMRFVLAHELAHCVQNWRWFDRRRGAEAQWWLEGTAEMLAAALYPDFPDLPQRRFPGFLSTIGSVPLTQQEYNAVVFMKWLWNDSPGRVFELMSAMPPETRGGEQAQREALIAFLGGKEALHRFARDLVDGKIGGPGGQVPPLPAAGLVTVTGTADVKIGGLAFTVQSRDMLVRDNDYVAVTAMSTVKPRVRPSIGAWQELPEELKFPDCAGGVAYRTGFFPTVALEANAQFKFIATKSCKKIALSGSVGAAQCLFGKWTLDNEAHGALLAGFLGKAAKLESVSGTVTFTFNPDRTARIEAANFSTAVRRDGDPPFRSTITANAADTGKWSADKTKITYQAGDTAMTYLIRLEALGTTQEIADQRFAADGQYLYQCAGDIATLTYAGPVVTPPDRNPRFELRRVKTP